MSSKHNCGTCGKKPLEGCSRIDCSERKQVTAQPLEGGRAYRLGVITSEDYLHWYEKGVRDADEV